MFMPNGRFLRNVLGSIGVVIVLAGCSSIPDAINPLEWYEAAKNAIIGKKTEEVVTSRKGSTSELVADRGKAAPGSDKPFPSLGSVPERSVGPSGNRRKKIAESLVSDREDTRQYSSKIVRRQNENKTAGDLTPKVEKLQGSKVAALSSSRKASVSEATTSKKLSKRINPLKPSDEQIQSGGARAKPPYVKKKAKPFETGNVLSANRNLTKPTAIKMLNVRSASYGSETIVISGSGVVTADFRDATYLTRTNITPNSLRTRSFRDFQSINDRQSYQVATILFDNGSAKLNISDRRVLRQVVAHHKQNGGTLRVVGHASSRTQNLDPARHQLVNFKISAARADAVLEQLVRYGTRPSNLVVGSVSDTMPKYLESMPSGEAGNRRAEIYLDF
ncbi:OmpA family protein [Rhodospirillales bacterium]|nr:OmpA family protein [Rhodospirillales bacterium]